MSERPNHDLVELLAELDRRLEHEAAELARSLKAAERRAVTEAEKRRRVRLAEVRWLLESTRFYLEALT